MCINLKKPSAPLEFSMISRLKLKKLRCPSVEHLRTYSPEERTFCSVRMKKLGSEKIRF